MARTQRSPDRATESDPERDREVARACLARLDSNDYYTWRDVGMALHSLGDDMLDDWHRWSSSSEKYKPREVDRRWAGFKRDGKVLGIGTLIRMAGLTKDERRGMGSDLQGGARMSIRRQTQKISAASVVEPKAPRPSTPAEADGKPTFPTLDDAVQASTPRGFIEAGRWRYRDDHWVVRFDAGDQPKRILPFTRDNGGRWANRGPSHRTLYRQDQLPEDMDEPVLVLEGEKCADIAAGLGFASVTSGASSSARKTDWSALRGRQVVVLPDQDDAGGTYAEAVREQLQTHGCEVSIVNLPGLADGEDIEQWAQREGDNAADALRDLVSSSDAPLPDMLDHLERVVDDLERTQGQQFVGLPCGMSQVDQMLDGFRGLVFLTGAPGCGKTNLALQAAAGVVDCNPDAAVLFVTLEMSPDELLRRLICQFTHDTRMDWHALVKGQGIDPDERAKAVLQAQGRLTGTLPRMQMLGQTDLHRLMQRGDAMSALRRAVRTLKQKTGAKRCMMVIDNFAHLPMPSGDMTDLELERAKTAALLTLQEQIGEAVLVIAQQSKDAIKSSEDGMVALKGAVEQIYAADAVLNLTRTDREALQDPRMVGNGLPRLIDRHGEQLPVVRFTMSKGRDGMHRRSVFMVFDHEQFQLVELAADQVSSGGTQ